MSGIGHAAASLADTTVRHVDTAVAGARVADGGLAALRSNAIVHGSPAGVTDALGNALSGIGDAVGNATNVKLHNDPEYVQAVILSLKGELPTPEATKSLTTKFGSNPLEGVPSKLIEYGRSDSAKKVSNTFRQVWSGLWLKFEDKTFPMRLRGALNEQRQAIENMTVAIQNYSRVILEGEDSIKAIETNITKWTKQLEKLNALPDGHPDKDVSLINRLAGKLTTADATLDARQTVVKDMKTAQKKLFTEQEFLRDKANADAERAEMLLAQRKLNKSLDGLDDTLNNALGKMTELESDVARIEGRTKQVGDAARRAAQQLADSGGLG